MQFIETAVRLHHEAAGQPFTGLQPAGSEPALTRAAEQSLAAGDPAALLQALHDEVDAAVTARFTHAAEARGHAEESVASGRHYVNVYADLMRFLAQWHHLAQTPTGVPPGLPTEHWHDHAAAPQTTAQQ